jgi:hypothetical protein
MVLNIELYLLQPQKLIFAAAQPLSKKNYDVFLPKSSQHCNILSTSFPQVFPPGLDLGFLSLRFTQTSQSDMITIEILIPNLISFPCFFIQDHYGINSKQLFCKHHPSAQRPRSGQKTAWHVYRIDGHRGFAPSRL